MLCFTAVEVIIMIYYFYTYRYIIHMPCHDTITIHISIIFISTLTIYISEAKLPAAFAIRFFHAFSPLDGAARLRFFFFLFAAMPYAIIEIIYYYMLYASFLYAFFFTYMAK